MSPYIGNAYASVDAMHERELEEHERLEYLKEQMIKDWFEGYVILGRRSVDAMDEFGSLKKAATTLVRRYDKALQAEAADKFYD